MFLATSRPTLRVILLSTLIAPATAFAAAPVTLDHAGAALEVSETAVTVSRNGQAILRLEAFRFNYELVDTWEVGGQEVETVTLRAAMPPSVDFYRAATDEDPRTVEITISKVEGGFRFFADPEWGRQVGLELADLGDHFFGLSEPLQPDNRLSPDLTGTTITVDVMSEAASMRENYASAFSAFYMSTLGYGAFFDTFARGEYAFAINGGNRIHHDTGTLDWYVFVGDTGTEIHRHYFALIGAPKVPPIWGLGPIAWRDQNNGGAAEILADIARFTELEIPLTAWFVDRPYSDGKHEWSKMNFNSKFAEPEKWIGSIRDDYGLEFMTWVATATFGDPIFPKQLGGRYSYLDLSHPPTVEAYQETLRANQYAVGVRGHKIDRTDEVFPDHELWDDGTPLAERRNRYTWLVARTIDEGIRESWGDDHFLFARSAIHRTQPFLSAIWGGDPRSTWEGLQGNFANAIRTSFMGFPLWGTDAGGYLGEGLIPEDLYTRWLQAASMAGMFEIKLDGSGGQGRDRMPWRYDEEFQSRFRGICEERMAFLPYLYSLASTSGRTGVLMKPMASEFPRDENTWDIWDQFLLGDAILVAPVFTADTHREVYLPEGAWRSFDRPSVVIAGGRTISVEADLRTLPRFIRENSIFVLGQVYPGNSSLWRDDGKHVTVVVNPSSTTGFHTFTYVDPVDMREKLINVDRKGDRINILSPALATASSFRVYLDTAPMSISVNGKPSSPTFDEEHKSVEIPIETDTPVEVKIELGRDRR